ncbi:Protein CBR-CPI-1 [Caenorhabditis briggsae]|uniref:Protein CBR-CPI-1 n=1 Tax=Caenorhabditis briggsae TaxID=6238 RepID=A8X029_CAEBR|nr:Protein CBR-CPI-1 [Caenorhabditis briggsae]CAP25989.2 Protein CBR-CPI-1 [Caenorhabditis briggsae]
MQYVFLIVVLFLTMTANGQMAGGLSDANATEYTVSCDREGSAWKSIPEINGQNNGGNYLVPIKVLKAQVQVVAGTNTILEVLVGESTCAKGGPIQAKQITTANCPLKANGQRAIYKVTIWEKVWENFTQITAEKVRDVKPSEQF